jgi:hypothetical protein
MPTAKDILLRPISAQDANALVRRVHYSGKVVNNSQLHIGVFLAGKLEGAMQFGPSLDKRKIQGLVTGTAWHEFLELNRMAFSEALPRNSESRALSVAMRLLRQHAPQVKWVISFADGTQCGDGTIYRAAGFVLTGIKQNDQIWQAPDGVSVATSRVATDTRRPGRQKLFAGSMTMLGEKGAARQRRDILSRVTATKDINIKETGAASMRQFKELGWEPLPGYQMRYIYFIDPAYRARLTVPEVPFSKIAEMGAGMYRGQKRGTGEIDNAARPNGQTGGASPTVPLLESVS